MVIFQSVLPPKICIAPQPPAKKKSYKLQLSIVTLLFAIAELAVDPVAAINIEGRFAPTGPILQFVMVLSSFPVVVPVEKRILPPTVPNGTVAEPKIEQFLKVLFVASAINRMVLVLAVLDVDKLEIIKLLPPVFSPSIVTKSAPLKSIKGEPAAGVPLIVAPTLAFGRIVKVFVAFAEELALIVIGKVSEPL